MNPIFQLLPITLDAIAVFATGFAAVGGAVFVSYRQSEILNRQTRIAENDLRIQLFEKRAACVGKMRNLYSVWFTDGELSADEVGEIRKLMFEVQLLFPAEVVADFEKASDHAFQARWQSGRSESYYKQGNERKAKEFLEQVFEHEDELMKLIPSLLVQLKDHTRIDLWD